MDYRNNTPYAAISRWINKYRVVRRMVQVLIWISARMWFGLRCFWFYLCPRHKFAQHTHNFVKRRLAQPTPTLSFLKALAINPRATGAIVPSSKRLARAMAAKINFIDNSLVVELGAGTGVITQAILDRGIPPSQVIAVEYAPHLAKKLRQRFPEITVIEGNAAHLPELLKSRAQPVSTIISGLPLRSLPAEIKESILAAIPQVLSVDGQYIQFTYDIRKSQDFYPGHYKLSKSTIVWRNIPPAKVGVYTCH